MATFVRKVLYGFEQLKSWIEGKISAHNTDSNAHQGTFSKSNHTHTLASLGAAAANHTHTLASLGAAAANHTHSNYSLTTHTHTLVSLGSIGFPNYSRAGSINTNMPSSTNPQKAPENGYLIVTLRNDGSGSTYTSFKLNIDGYTILAGRVQSTSHWYNSGCGATVLPLKKDTTWFVPSGQHIGTFYWQFIPMA